MGHPQAVWGTGISSPLRVGCLEGRVETQAWRRRDSPGCQGLECQSEEFTLSWGGDRVCGQGSSGPGPALKVMTFSMS